MPVVQSLIQVVVLALFFFSGATALVYQNTWLRELSLIFGASFQATSIVLASFMGGLALGGFAFGRLAERLRRPLLVYGLLEIGVALFALFLPDLLHGVDDVYVSAALEADAVTPGLAAMRFVLAFGVLVLPTFLMGATLPVLIRFTVHSHRELASRLAWMYGINTVGAAAGAVTAGFVLMPSLGVAQTQIVAVWANLAIGALAIALDVVTSRSTTDADAGPAPGQGERPTGRDLGVLPARLAFIGTGVAGLAALALEVMWTRAITLSVGSTTYSFTVMIAAFLIGIWLGSWLHALFPLRRVNESVQLGFVLLAIGLSGAMVSQWIPRLPELVVRLNVMLYQDLERVQHGTTLLAAFSVMLVPCIFMGMAFPLAGQARARLSQDFGESVGDTLGLNTLGSIAGSLLAGFVLIPALGLQRSMLMVAMLDVAYGIVILAACAAAASPRARLALPVSVAVALALVVVVPRAATPWDLDRFAAFGSDGIRQYVRRGEVKIERESQRIRYYEEGRSATVVVYDSLLSDIRAINVNGKTVASDNQADMAHELLLGHIPALLHRDPHSALIVGLGAGVTLSGVAAHERIEELVLVEIEPAVVEGARLFSHVNGDVLDDPRLEIFIQDGRNFLKTTNRKFDVITADPIHPWAAGSAYLYTTDYYALAAERLEEGGVMCQWVPLTALSIENFRSIVRSFADNFAYVSVWNTASDVGLIGSNQPIDLDMRALAERLEEPRVREQLGWIRIETPEDFMARLAAEDLGVRAYVRDAIVNTDDNLYIEFAAPLSVGELCHLRGMCGLSSYYPGQIAMVASWAPVFDSAADATAALERYRRENPQRLINPTAGARHVAPRAPEL